MKISDLGYLEINEELLNKHEKEEKLGIKQDLLIESQYIYFNSTNKSDLLIYNKLSNCLFRINKDKIFEYDLPGLYEMEFSKRPEYMIMYILDNNEDNNENKDNNQIENTYLTYILEDLDQNKKVLVFRKIHIKRDQFSISEGKYIWTEIDYIEKTISLETETIRGIMWWNNTLSSNCPSIMFITDVKLQLYSIEEKKIQLMWELIENNLNVWYNMEFQSILLQTGTNILTPYINMQTCNEQKPVRLQDLELLLNKDIKHEDILLIKIYQSLYCIHLDNLNKRVSLRDLFDQLSSDLVLNINENFEEFTLLLINDVIVILNIHDKKTFGLFDIKLLNSRKFLNNHKIDSNISVSMKNSNLEANLMVLNDEINEHDDKELKNNDNDFYYLVPSLFNDKLKDDVIVCLYNNENLDLYKKFAGKVKNHLNDYSIILINSSINLIIKINFNKIQYSKLKFSVNKLIDDIITIKDNNDINIEKIDIIPFILNRDSFWDSKLLKRLKKLIGLKKESCSVEFNKDDKNSDKLPLILILILGILKIKLELKKRIDHEYYLVLIDLVFHYKRESLLQYILQYHIVEDSQKVLNELHNMYLYNKEVKKSVKILDNKNPQYFELKNKLWLEQTCLDMSYRLNDIKIMMDLLINRREYRRAIKILRNYSKQEIILNINENFSLETIISTLSNNNEACKYPIYNILYEVGIDVNQQKNDPYLFKDLIKEIQSWINNYLSQINSINEQIKVYKESIKPQNQNYINNERIDPNKILISVIGRPNINKCNIWLPELINMKDLNNNDILADNNDELERDNRTVESIYMSATESNETFIVANKNDSLNSSKSQSLNNDFILRNNVKSPLLHFEPNLIESNLYNRDSSDMSPSISSTSSSSFNSYE